MISLHVVSGYASTQRKRQESNLQASGGRRRNSNPVPRTRGVSTSGIAFGCLMVQGERSLDYDRGPAQHEQSEPRQDAPRRPGPSRVRRDRRDGWVVVTSNLPFGDQTPCGNRLVRDSDPF